MIKSSSMSHQKIQKLSNKLQTSYKRSKASSQNIGNNQNHLNKNTMKSILLKNAEITDKNFNRQKELESFHLNNTQFQQNNQQIKKGLKMITKNIYHNLNSKLSKPQISLKPSIKNSQPESIQTSMEKFYKSYFNSKNVYYYQQFKQISKKQKDNYDKFLNVLTKVNQNQRKKRNIRYSSKDKNEYYLVKQHLIKRNQNKKMTLNIRPNLFNNSLRQIRSSNQGTFKNEQMFKRLRIQQILRSQDQISNISIKNQQQQKQNQFQINPQHNTKLNNFVSDSRKNYLHINFLNEQNHQSKYSTTNKMCSTKVSYQDNIENKSTSPNTKIKINQFFVKHYQLPFEDSIIYEEQYTQPNDRTVKSGRQLLLEKYNQFSPQRKKQKLNSQKRLFWKSKLPIQIKPKQTSEYLRNIQTPKKQSLYVEKCNQNHKPNSTQFKILKNKIIQSLNQVRTVQTKMDEKNSVNSSNQKIEQSIIIFKGSSNAYLNQKLDKHDSASPFKKKLAIKLSYSAQKNLNNINQFNQSHQQNKNNKRNYEFLKYRKQRKSTENQIKQQKIAFPKIENIYKKQSSLLNQQKCNMSQMDVKQISSRIQTQEVSKFQIKKERSLVQQIKIGVIHFKNIKQIFEELSYILEKQYQKNQIKISFSQTKLIQPKSQHQKIQDKQLYQILNIFVRRQGQYEIIKLKEKHLQKSLDQLNGILMMELCSQVRFYQNYY